MQCVFTPIALGCGNWRNLQKKLDLAEVVNITTLNLELLVGLVYDLN